MHRIATTDLPKALGVLQWEAVWKLFELLPSSM
jgi:hypothetical protein